jgi:predicted PurR-regulated permease PerM
MGETSPTAGGHRQLTGRRAAQAANRAGPAEPAEQPARAADAASPAGAVEPLDFETTTAVTAPPEVVAGAAEAEREAHLHRTAWWWIRAAAITVTLFVGWQLLLVVQGWVAGLLTIVLYVIFGAVVAFAATPIMRALERWAHFRHLPAVLCSLLAVLIVVAALVYLVAGPLATEITGLVKQAPKLLSAAQEKLGEIQHALNARGISIGSGGSGALGGLLGGGGVASHLGSIVVTGVTGVVTVLVDTVIVLVTAFWILNDGTALRQGFVQMLPGRVRDHADFALDATQVVIGGYVRAQLFLALVIGLLAWVGCTALGVPYPIVVGVAAGVFELVPLLGPFLGGAVAVLLALTRAPILALWAVLLFVGIHVVEGYILAPRIQAKFIQLHPLVAFLALIAGIEVAGLLGALFAVPATSLAAVFLRATIGDWRANRPEMFQASLRDAYLERRRRTLLREFRVLHRSPWALFLHYGPPGWWSRLRGRPAPGPEQTPTEEDIEPRSGGPV